MALSSFDNVGITGLAACVPKNVINNLASLEGNSDQSLHTAIEKIGVYQRRWAPSEICASDLCEAAANRLLEDMNIDRSTIGALIFVSQTPDYRMPATSILLQDKLGLKTGTIAFDINLGCSGFIYGLYLAYSMLTSNNINKVLLLNGETRTRAYSFRDRSTGHLFGDAGTATLIERQDNAGKSFFSLNSDGSRGDLIAIKAGGYRNPSTSDTLIEKLQPDGGYRSDEQGYMDGTNVLAFILSNVRQDIVNNLQLSNITKDNIDFFVFHQASRLALESLRNMLDIPDSKVPFSLDEFGNTSGPSIPLTMITRLQEHLKNSKNQLLLSGFGVGLSWGNVILTMDRPNISSLIEIE